MNNLMKDQHINRRDFLNIVGITAATTTAALYGCAPKDQKSSGSKASSPVPTDQMTYRSFPSLGEDKVSLLGYGCMRWPTIPSPDGKGDLIDQDACKEVFADVDGIIVPGGFGDRGIEGMIQAAQYARENRVPCFGICLGMQIMVIEFARNVLGYKDANSSEFTPDGAHNVISLMPDQQGNIPKGGTMRLGKYPCTVAPGTKMAECYGESEIWERHRHRYEFNNDFRQEMQDAGLVISGTSPDGHLVETVELPGRDFHLGAQFHPEFKSRPNRAHPLFKGFIAAALRYRAAAQRDMLHL